MGNYYHELFPATAEKHLAFPTPRYLTVENLLFVAFSRMYFAFNRSQCSFVIAIMWQTSNSLSLNSIENMSTTNLIIVLHFLNLQMSSRVSSLGLTMSRFGVVNTQTTCDVPGCTLGFSRPPTQLSSGLIHALRNLPNFNPNNENNNNYNLRYI